jgi:hypothetical protein
MVSLEAITGDAVVYGEGVLNERRNLNLTV